MEYKKSFLDESVYQHNAGGLVGGYPVMHVIDAQNTENRMLGGSTEIGTSRFENLVIPIGLTTTFYGGENTKKANDMGCIDDTLFDRLFGMVNANLTTNRRTTKKHMPILFKNQSKKRK